MTIGENRLELLVVAVQEERSLLLRSVLLAFGVAAFVLLAGIALTAAVVISLWAYSPVYVLLTLAVVYSVAGLCLYRRLTGLQRNWHTLSTSLDQLRKDQACLEQMLS